MSKLLLLPVLCSVWFTLPASAADCSKGSADDRLTCLQQQTCPDANSDAELLACYRTISLTLLAQPASTAAPIQWITATERSPAVAVAPAPAAPAQVTPAPSPDPAPTQAAPVVASTPDANGDNATPASDPTANFGLQTPPTYTQQKQTEPDEISAVIVQLMKQPRGNYLIALDNGQLWEENEPTRSSLKTGQSVRIVKRLMNAYKLVPAKGRSTNVSRVPCYQGNNDKRCALLAAAPDQP